MTHQEQYAKALKDLLAAQKLIEADNNNPFNFGVPTHLGLSNNTFISDEDLSKLIVIISDSINDNQRFAKIWMIGNELLIKAKAMLLV